MNNFFMYRPEISNQFRLIVWDKSQAFTQGQAYPIWHNITDVPEANRNRLMSHALESPDLRTLYLDTLLEAGALASEVPIDTLPGDTRGWLEREIDRGNALIAPSVLADTVKPYTNDEFVAAVEYLRLFAPERMSVLNADVDAARSSGPWALVLGALSVPGSWSVVLRGDRGWTEDQGRDQDQGPSTDHKPRTDQGRSTKD